MVCLPGAAQGRRRLGHILGPRSLDDLPLSASNGSAHEEGPIRLWPALELLAGRDGATLHLRRQKSERRAWRPWHASGGPLAGLGGGGQKCIMRPGDGYARRVRFARGHNMFVRTASVLWCDGTHKAGRNGLLDQSLISKSCPSFCTPLHNRRVPHRTPTAPLHGLV